MRRGACVAGVLVVFAASLVSCVGRSVSISPPAARHISEIEGGVTDQVRAGLRHGGYGPPQSMQEAQQALSQQGRAGNPNYNIVNGRGTYVYAVGDH
jgi:hypothetical protein